jgi:hypothetical protein
MIRAFNLNVVRLGVIALAAWLAGCSGGASTTENPVTNGPTAGPNYTGPAPANADIQAFRINFWENIRGGNRCGNCHAAGGQAPTFARSDDVNQAYQQAGSVINRDSPSQSALVLKVAGGHNCWLADAGACATILTRWITDWVGASDTAVRQIELVAPPVLEVGASRRFPTTPPSSFTDLHNLFTGKGACWNCHRATSATAQAPYFASPNINEAYLASIPKINLDDPALSRFVVRLRKESHNCWSASCEDDAQEIQDIIAAMQTEVPAQPIDPTLILSKAVTLYDGTIASGGSRYESNVIALYEFQTGNGGIAYDTSGVDPAADLTLAGQQGTDYEWVGGWGIMFKTPMAKAQASTTTSRKLHQLITSTGEYSIEAWVIPGNVTQEDARIVSYSGSTTARNFTMGQTMYSYDFFGRSTATGQNGTPLLSTDDDDQRLQAALQHVVMTFDPVNGRRIYVNGEFTGDVDAAGGGTLGDWDNSFALVLGNEVSSNRPWSGVVRLVAIHNRALSLQQVQQNFAAGVGQKFFLLFGVEHITNVPKSYIMFEASQYDSYGYLFTSPKFISLDPDARPGSITLRGMRIGVNGAEPTQGQAYRLLEAEITDAQYSSETGQLLSSVGTIIGVEHGPNIDRFHLCFDQLGSQQNACSDFAPGVAPTPVNEPRPSDIGVRTFDEINASMAAITGVDPNTASVKQTFTNVRQSLPAVSDVQAFLSSHQTSIAQLGAAYCAALIGNTTARQNYFPGFDFGSDLTIQANRNLLINPLIESAIGNVTTQPDDATVRAELNGLIDTLCTNSGGCSGARTVDIAKAVCGATISSAAVLIK